MFYCSCLFYFHCSFWFSLNCKALLPAFDLFESCRINKIWLTDWLIWMKLNLQWISVSSIVSILGDCYITVIASHRSINIYMLFNYSQSALWFNKRISWPDSCDVFLHLTPQRRLKRRKPVSHNPPVLSKQCSWICSKQEMKHTLGRLSYSGSLMLL